jgi:alpha-1,3-mannosyltransferase
MKPLDPELANMIAGRQMPPLIVHVVRQFLPNRGGLEDVVFNLARRGVIQGYRVRVVTLNSLFSDPERPLSASEIIDGIEVVRIPWRGSSRYPLAPRILRHISDADLVHVHAIDFFFDFLALTSFWHRKPMISTTHGGFFHTTRFGAIKKLWFQTLTRFSASRYRYVVGCSLSDGEQFSTIAPSNVRVIENGTNIDKFANAASQEPRKRIVSIGRFSINKRLDRLIEMMAQLTKMDSEWRLNILGVPSDLTESDVDNLIADCGIQEQVRVHASLPNVEIQKLMGGCSFFASASEYEGFGIAAIEAMSAGLVPILHPNEAFKALADKHSGLVLSDFSDARQAAETVITAFADLSANHIDLPARLKAAAAGYSWSAVAGDYFRLYDQAMMAAPVR